MELINKIILLVRNEIFISNTYILKSKSTGNCIIIDPGLSPELIDKAVTEHNLKPIGIIATHGHFDHIGSVSYFKDKYNIPFYLHQNDFKLSQSANFYLKLAKISYKINTPKPDSLLTEESQNISIGEFTFNISNFPGHTRGSCVINFESFLFSGDLIYKNGLGFNNFPGEDKNQLKSSILELFNTYNNDFVVLPGHGQPETLKNIKNHNLELKKFLNL